MCGHEPDPGQQVGPEELEDQVPIPEAKNGGQRTLRVIRVTSPSSTPAELALGPASALNRGSAGRPSYLSKGSFAIGALLGAPMGRRALPFTHYN